MWPECLALLYSFHAPEVMKSSLMAVAVNQFDDGMIPGSGISNQQFAEYSCWWMALLDRFYFLTGDEEFIHDLAPYIRRHMNWLVGTIDENGGYLHVDQGRTWAWTLMRQGVVTGSQCVAFAALQGGARMLELIGDTSEAASSRELAANLKNLIQTKLWDDEEGALRDSKEPPDGIPRYSCDSNSLGALFGVLDEDKAKRALAFLKKNLWTKYGTRTIFPPEPDGEKNWAHNHNIWPFVVGLELEARFETADFENALELARTCWGTMIANDAEAFWEIIDSETGEFLTRRRIVEGDPNWDSWDSYSHGWSAGITYMFQAFLLGVRPLEPGFRRFQVTPHLAGLDFISGAVPTPHGQIRVKLKANELEVTVPEGTEAVVAIGTSDSKVLQPGHHKLTV
jgi:glycogen debranching enzyme